MRFSKIKTRVLPDLRCDICNKPPVEFRFSVRDNDCFGVYLNTCRACATGMDFQGVLNHYKLNPLEV